jgi:hypothetical protein
MILRRIVDRMEQRAVVTALKAGQCPDICVDKLSGGNEKQSHGSRRPDSDSNREPTETVLNSVLRNQTFSVIRLRCETTNKYYSGVDVPVVCSLLFERAFTVLKRRKIPEKQRRLLWR